MLYNVYFWIFFNNYSACKDKTIKEKGDQINGKNRIGYRFDNG